MTSKTIKELEKLGVKRDQKKGASVVVGGKRPVAKKPPSS